MAPSDVWPELVEEAVNEIIVKLYTDNFDDDLFGYLKQLLDEKIEVTEFTWEIKNMIASLAHTDPKVLRGRQIMINAVIERCDNIATCIRLELLNAE